MMNGDAKEGFDGFREWSEPVIRDRLREAYGDRLGDIKLADQISIMHSAVWGALLRGVPNDFERLRNRLVARLAEVGLDLEDLAEADSAILVELLEIVLARYRGSQRAARGYHLALIEMATRLRARAA